MSGVKFTVANNHTSSFTTCNSHCSKCFQKTPEKFTEKHKHEESLKPITNSLNGPTCYCGACVQEADVHANLRTGTPLRWQTTQANQRQILCKFYKPE